MSGCRQLQRSCLGGSELDNDIGPAARVNLTKIKDCVALFRKAIDDDWNNNFIVSIWRYIQCLTSRRQYLFISSMSDEVSAIREFTVGGTERFAEAMSW